MLRSTSRRLQVESLEKRELMAGNVNVFFQGNDLYIVGDNASNGVEVRQSSPGVLKITGNTWGGDYTRINGYANGTCTASGVGHDVKILMYNGNDHLDFGTGDPRVISIANNLVMDMGAGSDTTAIRDVRVGGTLSVATGTGVNDSTYVVSGKNVGNNLLIGDGTNVNNGDYDVATVNSCTVRNQIAFTFHQGNDSAEIVSSTADSIYADIGTSNDFFKMTYSRARASATTAARGNDSFFVPDYAGTHQRFRIRVRPPVVLSPPPLRR